VIADYQFRSDHQPDPRTTRWFHLLFYLGALLLLVAAVHSIYVYWTDWSAGDDNSHLWNLLLGLVYLIVSGLIAYATYHHGRGREEPAPSRYLIIEDGVMTYELDQLAGRRVVDLTGLESVSQPSVRELRLRFRDKEDLSLPVYLIDEPEKQVELRETLQRRGSRS
jgi:hypothetical protein